MANFRVVVDNPHRFEEQTVHADQMQITTEGSLAFYRKNRGEDPRLIKAFSVGFWKEVTEVWGR